MRNFIPVATLIVLFMFGSSSASSVDTTLSSVAETCRLIAAGRAVFDLDETCRYSEPLAHILAGNEAVESARQKRLHNGRNQVSGRVIRHMMIDAILQQRTSGMHDPKQVVIIGAGMDTRAYRLALPGMKWFEVDQEKVIALKESLLQKAGEDLTKASRISMDLTLSSELASMIENLEAAGFRRNAPTIFILEGLLYYLSPSDIEQVLAALPTVPGSVIVYSMINKALLDFVKSNVSNGKASIVEGLFKSHLGHVSSIVPKLKVWKVVRMTSCQQGPNRFNLRVSTSKSRTLWDRRDEIIVEMIAV
jgi:methyltransferase (TIGR00027 family)